MKIRQLLFLLAFLCLPMHAQESIDRDIYLEDAGGLLQIYQGHQPLQYTSLFNGTYLWSYSDYQSGDVMMNGRLYTGILLNIDAYRQEILVKPSQSNLPVAVSADAVEWLERGGQRFVNFGSLGCSGLPSGLGEELFCGKSGFYKTVRKVYKSSMDNVNGAKIGYDDPHYKSTVYNYFQHYTTYYLVAGGNAFQVKSKGTIYKAFPSYKKELKRYVRVNELGLKQVNLETFYMMCLKYLESL